MKAPLFAQTARIAVLAVLTCSSFAYAAKKPELTAQRTPVAIEIDGVSEDAWSRAVELKILVDEMPYEPNNGYEGMKKTNVFVKALYDDQHLYMQFVWKDKTKDLQRFPWEKQNDGSWVLLKNLDSTIHENTYYEDKVSVFWNINEKGFEKKGCDKSCHIAEEGMLEGVKDSSAGRHYTLAGTLDEWQWKGIRTNPNFQLDDGFVDSEHNTNKKWGRHPDTKTGGGYYTNVNKEHPDIPAWMSEESKLAASSDPIYHVFDHEKIPFEDTFQPGDRLPGIVTAPLEGPRGDVTARGEWKGGVWTLEVKRKLITRILLDDHEDLQFKDLTKAYYFGVAIFDNAQIAHLHHTGSIKLLFE